MDSRVRQAYLGVAERLLDERTPDGHWEGELSTSALSTATAVFALACVERHRSTALPLPREKLPREKLAREELARLVERGRGWLTAHANADGGWGDTAESPSNLSTTVLCWAALAGRRCAAVERAESWIRGRAGGLGRAELGEALRGIYGDDRTFAVPILTTCALAGSLGPGEEPWRDIPALPFELANLPRGWFKRVGLPVVSYALPALIAIGQVQHHHAPSRFAPLRWLRERSRRRTLDLLATIQPASGGFLEAVPLTSFVTMSLAASGAADHPVVDLALDFLAGSVRGDGGWPIDVHLATWVTTLAVQALTPELLGEDGRRAVVEWLLGQQHLRVHPFTAAAPGGWAWTYLPGGVPDADDTAGALLALARLAADDPRATAAAEQGVRWLIDLQNRDGGVPTFCRGWGKLPFDRSSPDLTAHALRAWHAWHWRLSPSADRRRERAARRALDYLRRSQRDDGSWVPLWFGHQETPARENPTYGTSRVVLALSVVRWAADGARERGVRWLLGAQNEDGGWGGAPGVASSPEETGLAVEALTAVLRRAPSSAAAAAAARGVAYLIERVAGGGLERPSPIGLYFAELWYSERLYPWIFAAAALGRWHERSAQG